jgi:1,4-dihydroxy-2-naphthoate octaprenyltransferase
VDLASSEEPRSHSFWGLLLNFLVHLRLHFQLLLAPIYLWGYFLSGAQPGLDFWLGFLAFHIFLYGGATAFNSYYDQDQGPIGGLSAPPPVAQAVMPLSLAVQLIGAILAAFVNFYFLAIYGLMFLMGIAYSHPRIRLKRRPIAGLVTVGLGQGVLASLGGWVCGRASLTSLGNLDWVGVLAVSLVTVGFYPITQIYQVEEDRSRGDWTLAVWVGPRKTFLFSLILQALAAVLLLAVINQRMGSFPAILVAIFYGGLLVYTFFWGRSFRKDEVLSNFRKVMAINGVTSLGFAILLTLYLFNVL